YSIDEMLSVYALMKNEKGKKALLYGNFKGLPDPQGHAAHIIQALTPEQRALADAVLADYDKSFDRLNARFIEAFNEGMEKEENYSPMKRLEYTSNEGLIDAESEETLRGRSVERWSRIWGRAEIQRSSRQRRSNRMGCRRLFRGRWRRMFRPR
ncbi:MAG: hypothetical protein ACOYD9_09170, partial [Pyramidobacter sp.]